MLRGIIPPMVTPFDERDEVDEGGLRAVARFLLNAGVHGLAVCGSTGEGHTLTPDETRRVTEVVTEEVNGRVPLVVGIIANSTRQALLHARAVRDLPVAALMVTPPHYLFTPDEPEMFAYFRTIAEETGLPVLVYNVVPWAYLTADALVRLMTEMPLVIGVKQSAGDIHTLAELLANLPEGKIVLSALDDVLYPSFLLGAHGAIAGLCTAAPRLSVALWEAVQKGEHEKALQLHHQLLALHRLLNGTNFPARVKAALIAQGVPAGRPRRPLTPLDESEMERFRQLLSAPTKGTA
ncbi:MAG: hypothetical protein IMHGJWDQ_001987 [Candidatus Fervidibacter sp.]